MDQVFLRVDVVCFFQEIVDEATKAYVVREPLIVLNELDIIGSASLLLDLLDPGRDALCPMRPWQLGPSGTSPVSEVLGGTLE